jgi:hypothetical protein
MVPWFTATMSPTLCSRPRAPRSLPNPYPIATQRALSATLGFTRAQVRPAMSQGVGRAFPKLSETLPLLLLLHILDLGDGSYIEAPKILWRCKPN